MWSPIQYLYPASSDPSTETPAGLSNGSRLWLRRSGARGIVKLHHKPAVIPLLENRTHSQGAADGSLSIQRPVNFPHARYQHDTFRQGSGRQLQRRGLCNVGTVERPREVLENAFRARYEFRGYRAVELRIRRKDGRYFRLVSRNKRRREFLSLLISNHQAPVKQARAP